MAALKAADDLYHNGSDSFLTDIEYDALRLQLSKLVPNHVYLSSVGSQVRTGKQKLPVPMPSLDQVQIGDFSKWLADNNCKAADLIPSKKMDGVSVLLIYNRDGEFVQAFTRGDGIEGADITRHVQHLNIPKKIECSARIRGEIICSRPNFERLKNSKFCRGSNGKPYVNPRNMIAGMLNSSELDNQVYQYLSCFVYKVISCSTAAKFSTFVEHNLWLTDQGFRVPLYLTADYDAMSFDGADSEKYLAEIIDAIRPGNALGDGYETDGLVMYVNDLAIAAQMDRDVEPGDNPKSAFKYKVQDADNAATAQVIDVVWDISKHGYYKPRVNIKPVTLVGVTVQYATGFNAKFIVDNGVMPGCNVTITRSGDVVPFIQSVSDGTAGSLTQRQQGAKRSLPAGGKWNETGVDWISSIDNLLDVICGTQSTTAVSESDSKVIDRVSVQMITEFFASAKIDGLREGTATKLYDAGFKSLADIITLDRDTFAALIGSNGNKIYDGIRKRFSRIEPWYIYGAHPAFGRGVGVRKWKALFDALGDSAYQPTRSQILSVDGFESKTADKIIAGMSNFNAFIADVSDVIKFEYQKVTQGPWLNSVIVFTGIRDSNAEQIITRGGGKIGSSVSSSTTLVVAKNPNDKSTKLSKAISLGIPIISHEQLKQRL